MEQVIFNYLAFLPIYLKYQIRLVINTCNNLSMTEASSFINVTFTVYYRTVTNIKTNR